MTIKYFAAVALLGMTVSGAAHAQSWERWDEGVAQASQEGAALTFGCDSGDGSAASLRAVVGFDRGDRAAMASMAPGRQYSAVFVVDGHSSPVRMEFITDGEEGIVLAAVEPFSEDGMKLVDLAVELMNGNRLVFQIPTLGVSVPFRLSGSRDALNGVYLGCGMWPTGTGVMMELDENGV